MIRDSGLLFWATCIYIFVDFHILSFLSGFQSWFFRVYRFYHVTASNSNWWQIRSQDI